MCIAFSYNGFSYQDEMRGTQANIEVLMQDELGTETLIGPVYQVCKILGEINSLLWAPQIMKQRVEGCIGFTAYFEVYHDIVSSEFRGRGKFC